MGRNQDAKAAATAMTFQQESPPAAQLLVTINYQNHRWPEPLVATEIQWEPPLTIVQFDKRGVLPGKFDLRNQCGQQGRLACAVSADDRAPPTVLLQPPNQRLRVLTRRKQERNRPGPNAPGAKRVFRGFVRHVKSPRGRRRLSAKRYCLMQNSLDNLNLLRPPLDRRL
jgi:hypothetical protein